MLTGRMEAMRALTEPAVVLVIFPRGVHSNSRLSLDGFLGNSTSTLISFRRNLLATLSLPVEGGLAAPRVQLLPTSLRTYILCCMY